MGIYNFAKRLVPNKIKPFLGRIFFKHHKFDSFSIVEIETTTVCNRRCSYCPNAIYDRGLIENKKEMDIELFKKIINELAEINYKGAIHPHFYGEPLLDKRLPELIRYAKEKLPKVELVIFTNGDLINIEKYNELVKAGTNRFMIAQHSKDELENVNELIEYKKIHEDGVKVVYNKLKTYFNRGDLIKVEEKIKNDYCLFPSTNITIDYDGNVILCCNDYLSKVKYGNVKSEKLMDIWNKPFYQKIREGTKKGIYNLELCKTCEQGSKLKE
ncbi:MAG: radical SAM protein [archaeon]